MRYEITARFTTDRSLTDSELSALIDTVGLQISEPADLNGEELDFPTYHFDVTIKALEGEGK
jgi:hypothetical protein